MEPRLVPEPDAVPVTELLRRIGQGDAAAEGRLWRQIYPDLHRLAERYRRNERADHTLSPTALINEAYLHIVRQRDRTWRNRAHFVGVAALVMRRVLVDYARRYRRGKRGGAQERVELDETVALKPEQPEYLLDLDAALTRLGELDPRQKKIVELRFFAGMADEEIAAVMGIGVRTVTREWSAAKAWLYGQLHSPEGP
jgi:RNA polymerase sigma factor (TIGR02999 family)